MDPNQWSMAYYSYGQGYDAYAYGAVQDPSLYGYGAYPGYTQYPQQVGLFFISNLLSYIFLFFQNPA